MHKRNLLRAATIAVLALVVGSAASQQAALQSYDVELIVFRNMSSGATPEDWTKEADVPGQSIPLSDEDSDDAPATETPPAPTATETFPALPAEKLQLGSIADTLRRSRNYQTLAHFGWTQPGFVRGEAHYMSIDSQAAAGSGLTGRVAVARGRYLHLTVDLALEPTGSGERYVLRQTRRMRSNERHYIDHPKFGVIALITQSEPQ